jgi:hypothetical protein
VRLGRSSERGLKLIIGRATAGDAIWFKATVDRIADILARRQGDTDTIDVRRSKAIGILAQPAHALQLLCQHQDDDWDGPTEASDDAEPAEDQIEFDQTASHDASATIMHRGICRPPALCEQAGCHAQAPAAARMRPIGVSSGSRRRNTNITIGTKIRARRVLMRNGPGQDAGRRAMSDDRIQQRPRRSRRPSFRRHAS